MAYVALKSYLAELRGAELVPVVRRLLHSLHWVIELMWTRMTASQGHTHTHTRTHTFTGIAVASPVTELLSRDVVTRQTSTCCFDVTQPQTKNITRVASQPASQRGIPVQCPVMAKSFRRRRRTGSNST